MARKKQQIRTESYVHVGDQLVRFEDLPPDLKKKASTELLLRYLNELFRGEARFFVEEDNT